MSQWYSAWRERHQHRVSFWLHAIAIPLLPMAGGLVVWQWVHGQWSLWYRPVVLFTVSYAMQWMGHRIEGNDMGEIILIKKWLNKPYTAVSPRYSNPPARTHEE